MNLKFTQQALAEANLSALKAAVEEGGFFAVTTGADGKIAVALTDSGKDHFAAEIATVQASLQAAIQEKNGVQAKLDAAPGAERTRIAAAVESGGVFNLTFDDAGKPALALPTTEGSLFALAPGENGKLALSLTEAGETQFVNAKSARVLAASGHKALAQTIDTPAPGNSSPAATGPGRTKSTWARQF